MINTTPPLHARRALCLLLGGLLLTAMLAPLACHRKTPEEQLREAGELLRKRDIIAAEMKYEDILKRNPNNVKIEQEARVGLHYCYQMDGDFDRSREELDQAIKLAGGPQSDHGFNFKVMKIQSFLREKPPKTEQALREALDTSRTIQTASLDKQQAFQLIVSELYMYNRQLDQAVEVLDRLLAQKTIDPTYHLNALEKLSMIYDSRQEPAKAIQAYQAYLTRYPDSPARAELHKSLGLMQRDAGQSAEADQSFDAAESQLREQVNKALGAEDRGSKLAQLADVQLARGRLVEASQTLRTILDKYPAGPIRPLAKLGMASVARQQGDTSQAIRILQEITGEHQGTRIAEQAQQKIVEWQTLAREAATSPTQALAPTTGTLPLPAAPQSTATQTTDLPAPPAPADTAPTTATQPAAGS